MPSQPFFLPNKKLLTADEISVLVSTFVSLGIRKIRLTGGEPLLRKDFKTIVELISLNNIALHLTTNGYYLNEHIETLSRHISSINISLDTLKKNKFSQITHRNAFERTLRNIDLCLENGLQVKLNVVIIRNTNHEEIIDFVNLTRNYPVEVRFIEFMPFQGNQWKLTDTFSHDEILETIKTQYEIQPLPGNQNLTAKKFAVKGWPGSIGIISTVSKPFCSNCNRIRVTADGKLKTCLFGLKEYDLKSYLNDSNALKQFIIQSLSEKQFSYGGLSPMTKNTHTSLYNKNRSMTAIGG
jgi:GTP 3',8-cyclase